MEKPAATNNASGSGHRPSIGLALGSGSARGLAHLGVIRAIEDTGIEVDFVAGTRRVGWARFLCPRGFF